MRRIERLGRALDALTTEKPIDKALIKGYLKEIQLELEKPQQDDGWAMADQLMRRVCNTSGVTDERTGSL